MWLKANSALHTLKTKLIEQIRLEFHSKNKVKDWCDRMGKKMEKSGDIGPED